VITGDDILIEYVSRVVGILRTLDEDFHDEGELSSFIYQSIIKFV
jgi:hypothetical protein